MSQKSASGKAKAWFSRNGALVFFALVFVAAMWAVFAKVFSPWVVISSPDDGPYYAQNHAAAILEQLVSGRAVFTPFWLGNLFAQVGLHEVRYVASVLLLALAGAYYLRSLRVDAWAAYGGGLFLGLSGYMFTLFCAGHLGFFWLMGGFFWTFGLLNRCLGEEGRLHHFMLLGAVAMWAQPGQPDVWVLFAAVFAFYALWRFWLARARLQKVWPKFLVTALIAVLVGLPGVRSVFTQHLAGRDRQIANVMSKGADTGQKDSAERWDFATGWSLPPSDCAELVIPGYFGNASFHPPYPFWGKLGSVPEEQERKPWPNYRQHTVYLGLVTVMMAAVGLLAWRRKPALAEGEADTRDVPFWCVVGLGALVLAMGRYTPCYRLFYSLPYMDYLRAPVKFLHFTEVAVAMLAGFGLHALVKRERVAERSARNLFFVAAGVAVALAIAAVMASLGKGAMEKQIANMGFGLERFAPTLSAYAVYNCIRTTIIALFVAGLMYVWKGGKKIRLAVCGIVLLGVIDLAGVARRYVQPQDVRAFHAENALVKDILQKTAGLPVNVVNNATRNAGGPDWFTFSLRAHGIRIVPDVSDPNSKELPVAIALQSTPERFLDALGARFMLLPAQQAEGFVRQGAGTLVGGYDLGADTIRRSATPSAQTVALVERKAATLPCVHFDWDGGVPPDKQAEQLAQSKLPVTDAPAPVAAAPIPPKPVAFTQMRGMRNVFTSRAEIDVPQAGLLVWNEHYSPDLAVAIDGKPAPLHQANGIWCAVHIPPGKHTVTCRVRPDGWMNLLSAVTSLLVALSPLIRHTNETHKRGRESR
ncbi:MAG: hypothetical protein FWG50_04155 [Kiritimatiellaeota bacterium]|nr:hypothetical protein [Kiritimatiellota bacterium]